MLCTDPPDYTLRPPRKIRREDNAKSPTAPAFKLIQAAALRIRRAARKKASKAAVGKPSALYSQRCAVRVTYTQNRSHGQWRAHGKYSPQEKYWQDAAASLLTGMILHICYAARCLGQRTIEKANYSFSGRRRAWSLHNMTASVELVERPLLTADEVGRLPSEAALVFTTGQRPICCRKIRYFDDPEFARRASIPPPRELVRIAAQHPCLISRPSSLLPTSRPPARPSQASRNGGRSAGGRQCRDTE
jgi:hypothetical protein